MQRESCAKPWLVQKREVKGNILAAATGGESREQNNKMSVSNQRREDDQNVEKVREGENERKHVSEFIKAELAGNGEECSRKRVTCHAAVLVGARQGRGFELGAVLAVYSPARAERELKYPGKLVRKIIQDMKSNRKCQTR